MRVLLTGSAGFIGGAVRPLLEAAGHEVVAVDAMLPQAHAPGEAPPATHVVDLRARDRIAGLLRGADAVCHQAALVGVETHAADLADYATHNDVGTATLLGAMADAGVSRLVLASSMVVYGEGRYRCAEHGDQRPGPRRVEALEAGDFENHCPVCAAELAWDVVDESARADPRSGYAASKLAQEHYVAAWARLTGATATALRYHNVYGPGMPRDTPYSGVAAMFRSSLARGEAPQVFEDGGQVRDFVHVADVARANLLALDHAGSADHPGFVALNVCSGRPITIAQVAAAVASGCAAGPAPVVTGRFRLGDVRHVVASPARARAELGFAAEVDPVEGLAAFATAPLRSPAGGEQVLDHQR